MNAVSRTPLDFVEEISGESDSDTTSDEASMYYQPISADGDEDDQTSDQHSYVRTENGDQSGTNFNRLPNGYARCLENGVSSLDLSGEDGEEEEERIRAASDSALRRALREDESRRSALLTPENAVRIREAMRGISFGGAPPGWAAQVPESQWIQRLQRIRQASSITTSPIHD
ncbi:hypothetical protein DM860_012484 [Cuscuta australis]|uniref:Uncharacterized protein n=1 Tax=Cuscuta australis TaxID=267555 RepID=A0A328DH74_9ASTE|nr:hypothetical protein DM860_012484 [Cuscuta australis]